MPEIPLWKLKIDGEEFPPPVEGEEDVPLARELTPEELDSIEFPRQAEETTAWYDLKRKEFEEFEASSKAQALKIEAQRFLSESGDVKKLVKTMRPVDGPSAWFILRFFFDHCKDSTTIDLLVSELWKPATDWILHARHREITLAEMKDLWKDIEAFETAVQPSPRGETPPHPEYDENFRYIIPGEDE